MLRFIPGLAKLPEKRKITQTEKRQRDCVYDRSKRNRGYSKRWEKEYEWLASNDENNAMFCSSCRGRARAGGGQYTGTIGIRGKNAFVIGTDNFRRDSLQAHNVSPAG